MRHSTTIFTGTVVFMFCVAVNAHAELWVKSKYSVGGQSNETVVYSKGARQRLEPGMGMAIINQNDVNRTVQLFSDKKMYMIMSPDMLAGNIPGAPAPPKAPPNPAMGGIVNTTIAVTDTGERKQMFGYAARHVKTSMSMEAGPGTCSPGNETIETDGWYIDYAPDAVAATASAVAAVAECKDDIRVMQTGAGMVGYPLSYKVKNTKDGKSTEMSMEVEEFSTDSLDATLFEVPAGYTELKGFADMAAMLGDTSAVAARASAGQPGAKAAAAIVPPKVVGATRVGVADVSNHAGRDLGAASPKDQLVSELVKNKVDAVPLSGVSATEVEAAAKNLQVDYIVYTDVTEVKRAGGGLGGLGSVLNKASSITGGGAPKEKLEAKVDYKLSPIDGSKPLLAASAKGSNGGGLGLGSTLSLASKFTPIGLLGKMGMFDPNMMRLFGNTGGIGGSGLGGGGISSMSHVPGMPKGGLDPSLSPFMGAMSATQKAMAPPEPTEDGKAVADAFPDAAKKISEALSKKK